jgi:hypothetical protein
MNGFVSEGVSLNTLTIDDDDPSEGIRSISYSKLFTLGGYENEKIDVTIQLAPGEDPDQAADRAKAWVERIHGEAVNLQDSIHELRRKNSELEFNTDRLCEFRNKLLKECKQISAIRVANGIPPVDLSELGYYPEDKPKVESEPSPEDDLEDDHNRDDVPF